MKIGMFGYPGDNLTRLQAMIKALQQSGATRLVCLGGIIWGGRRDEEQGPPANVLRWLRASDIPTLANDNDRQVAGWRLQALENTTGYIQPRVRRFLSAITREEGQWIYGRPATLPIGKVLCSADSLTIDAHYPAPLTRYNAGKLFGAMEQKAAFFPSANGPSLIVRQESGVVDASKYDGIEESLDAVKVAGIIGGVVGSPPLNGDVSWGAVVDEEATQLSLVCLDTKTHQRVPEFGSMLIQRAELHWRE
ncbi:MAG TPA: hypothetical protein VGP72_33975 [Planctomycetota bacterium]|jgi:hypothetical protein